MVKTKKIHFILTFIYYVVIALALNIGQYHNGCGGTGGELEDETVCAGYNLEYVKTYDLPCYEGIIPFARYYQLLILLGLVVVDLAYFKLWRALS
jgi:hypothetical protein